MDPTFQCVFDSNLMIYRISEKNVENGLKQARSGFDQSRVVRPKTQNIKDLTDLLKIG